MPDPHPISLDIIVATHNRADRLRVLLDSIRDAHRPDQLSVRVIVADNRSTDGTAELVRSYPPIHGQAVVYLFESRPGQAFAHNTAIGAVTADLAGFLDDDERIGEEWLPTVLEAFQDSGAGFISGPCLPDWGAPPPAWLPRAYPAVIGWVDAGPEVVEYGPEKTGMMMMGGNCVIRTEVIRRVGLFDERLGRVGQMLTTGEDAEYYARLLAAGVRGLYLPRLAIYHYVPPDRMQKGYYRRWCFFRGTSLARIDRIQPQPVAYLLGVPRYFFGEAARGGARVIRGMFSRDRNPEQQFASELPIWDLAGFLYGRLRDLVSGARHQRPQLPGTRGTRPDQPVRQDANERSGSSDPGGPPGGSNPGHPD